MNELKIAVLNEKEVISFNYEEIKNMLAEKMSEYDGAVFTDDSMSIAKKEVASLRKMKKELNDRKIEVKKEFMKPYDDFEEKVKELSALIEKPILLINDQVTEFEENRRIEKKNKVVQLYEELESSAKEIITLERIYSQKWENTTTSIKSIKEEIEAVFQSTEQAIDTLKSMNSEASEKAIELYEKDLSLANAITYITKYEQQKQEILLKEKARREEEERRKQAEAEEKIRREERRRIEEEERIRTEERKKTEEIEQKAREEERRLTEEKLMGIKEEVVEFTDWDEKEEQPFVVTDSIKKVYIVECTTDEHDQVEMYLNSIGVLFRKEV